MVSLALAGCADDDSQAQIDSLRDALATANAESASLRASGRVLQTRLAATQVAARTAGDRLHELSTKLELLTARQAALSEANAQASQRLRAAESAIAHFKGGFAAASQALSASEARNTALSHQLAAVSGWLGQRDALGQSQDNTLKNMESDLQRRSSSLTALGEQLTAQKESLQRARADADRLGTANAQLDVQLKALQTKFAESSATSAQRIAELEQQQRELSTQHKATVATMLDQHEQFKAAAQSAAQASQQARAQSAALQIEDDNLRAQLEQLRLDHAAGEQRTRDAKQAKDYLDGKLSTTVKELEAARAQHRTALLRIEQALQLSVEESRVLQQREREMREQLTLTQQSSSKNIDDLRARLSTSAQALDGLNAQITSLEGRVAYLKARNTEQVAQLGAVRDELAATVSAAQADAKACAAASEADAATVHELKSGNETLRTEIEKLQKRLQVLEAVQSQCKLEKTAL